MWGYQRKNQENVLTEETLGTQQESHTKKMPKDKNWGGWKSMMNRVSRGKLYKDVRTAHTQWKAKQQHLQNVSMAMPDADAGSIVAAPTGSRERQEDIRNQLADYAERQLAQTERTNAFVQKEYGLGSTAELGSFSGRMMLMNQMILQH